MRFLQPSLAKALLLLGGIFWFAGLPSQAQQQQFTIGNYQQISQRRVSLYVYEYVYQAYVTNSGAAAVNVLGTVTSTSSHTTIIDNTLSFGDVAGNTSTLSLNTFRFQQDRRYAFSFSNLQWTITSAPAQPPIANAGPAQTVPVGTTVTLNGNGSSDPNGSGIVTIQWTFDSIPTGSSAKLSNANTFTPSFIVDVAGQYIARLTITDALGLTGTAAVTISTVASPPVADAGMSQTVPVGTKVTLDGSGSTDVDGAPLTFAWSFISIPTGSTAVLSNATSVNPSFTVDKVGNYVVQLLVTAEGLTSAPSQVTISTTDVPPVANAGPAQTVSVGSMVSLNGSGSSDLAGNPITFSWSFVSKPTGSTATLNNATAVNPTFVADRVGDYVVQLIVNDGILSSAPSTVTIASNDVPPVANAGPGQTVTVNTTVTLDGSKSTDSDGNPLTYSWSLTVKPAQSNATLLNATTAHPSFTVDVDGSYVAQLIVNDGFLNSAPATVTITTEFSTPTANAGPAQTVSAGSTVQLDGSKSSDPDGSALAYSWMILNKPLGSAAVLSNATIVNPTFVADMVGSYLVQLTVSSNGLTSAPSTVMITATTGTATQLVFTVQPSNTGASAPITPAVAVSIEDAQGNVVTSATNTVTIAIGTNPSSGTLAGTLTGTPINGVVTFSNLSINNAGTGYTLTASATGLSPATSTAFNITAGTAAKLVFTVQPSNTGAGAPITPAVAVSIEDAQGNVVTSATNTVTIAIGTNPSSGTLAGTLTGTPINGVVTFSNLSINNVGLGYTLTASATGLSPATSTAFNITAGTAAKLVFTVQPSNTGAGAPITPAVAVSIEDAQGNVVTSATNTVTIAIGTNPSSGTLAGTLTGTPINGVVTFSNLSINNVGLGYTLTASATGLSPATSTAFNITAGTAAKLVFTVQPSNARAGAPITPAVAVSIEDAQGNVVTSAANTVTIAIGTNPSSGTLAGTLTGTPINGVVTFSNLSINNAGTGYTLTASATGLSPATSTAFNITAGTAAKLVFTVQPSNARAGAPITPAVAVSIEDAQGNVVTSATNTVTIAIGTNPSSGTLAGTLTGTPINGVVTFSNLSINNVGLGYTLTASATGLSPATSTAFNITAGTAAKLVFTVQPSNTGASAPITPAVAVSIEDAQGNVVTSATNTVTIAIGTNPSSGTLAGTLTGTPINGVVTFSNLSINNVGLGYTLTASATGLSPATSTAFNITAGTAAKLVFTVQPSNARAGAPITPAVAVSIEDAQGNVVTSAANTVTIAIGTNPSSGTLAGTLTGTPINGVVTFSNLSINNAGTGYTLTASATGLSPATSTAFNITAGTAAKLVFTVQPSNARAGAPITPAVAVSIEDAQGNVVTSATNTVTIAIGTNPSSGTLAGTLTGTPINGVVTFSNLSINNAGTGYTLTASATGLSPATSTAFNITAGTAAKLVFTVQPSNTGASAPITPAVAVSIEDAQGNVVTSATNTVTIAIGTNPSSGTLAGTLTGTPINGVVTFSNLSINNVGLGYTLTASATGLSPATSTAFNITTVNTLLVTPAGPTLGVGRSFGAIVTLSAPAPTGGVSVTLSSGNTSIITVSPASVAVPAGGTTASFTLTGVTAGGPITLTATAINYMNGTNQVTVTSSVISLATGLVVAPGQTSSLAFSLSSPAPTGGLTVNFTSSNTSIATITLSVVVPAGATVASANPQVTGVTIGTVNITATATGYAQDTQSVQVTVTASLASASVSVNATRTVNDQLSISVAAPQPSGITFTLSIDNTSIATVPPTITIPGGQLNVQIPITGVAAGTANLMVTSPGINTPTAVINVSPAPGITVGSISLGNNLETAGSITLGAAVPSTAVSPTITLTTGDPTHLLLSDSPTVAGHNLVANGNGTSSLTLNLTPGSAAVPAFYLQGQGLAIGPGSQTVTLTASVSGFTTNMGTITILPSAVSINNGNINTTTFSLPTALSAELCAWNSVLTGETNCGQPLGPQAGGSVSVTFTSGTTTVGTISGTGVVTFAVNGSNNAAGVSFQPATAGASTISINTPAGFSKLPTANTQITATVTAPAITVSALSVGNNLETTGGITLGAAVPSTAVSPTITLTTGDPTHLLLSDSPTVAGHNLVANGNGTSSLTLNLTPGSAAVPAFYLQGQGLAIGPGSQTVTLTASVSGFTTNMGTITILPSAVSINNGNINTTTFSLPTALSAELCAWNSVLTGETNCGQPLGPQAGGSVSVTFTSGTTTVGTISGTGVVTFAVNGSNNAAGVSFQPATAGASTISINTPAGFSKLPTANTQITATVTAPAITVSALSVGNNLETTGGITLGAAVPSTAVSPTITLTTSDPTHLLLSDSPTVAGHNLVANGNGTSSLTLNLTPGSAAVPAFYLQGQGLAIGPGSQTVTLTASVSGFTTNMGTITILPSAVSINNGNINTTTFSLPTALSAELCAWNSVLTGETNCGQPLGPQAGGSVSVTFTSGTTTVGTISGTGVVTFAVNGSNNAAGVSFQPATAGASTISINTPAGFSKLPTANTQITATVTAPAITVSALSVGNNLETTGGITLGAAVPSTAVSPTITLTTSDPTHLLLSDSPTVAGHNLVANGNGTSSLTLNLTPGSAAVPAFYLQGQGLAPGPTSASITLTAKISGFSDGNGTITILPSAVSINNGNFTTSTTSGPTALSAELCAWNSVLTGATNCGQPLGPQAGGSVSVTFTSGTTTVGTISGTGVVTFAVDGSNNAAGVSFQPVTAGNSTISINTPAGFSTLPTANTQITATVN